MRRILLALAGYMIAAWWTSRTETKAKREAQTQPPRRPRKAGANASSSNGSGSNAHHGDVKVKPLVRKLGWQSRSAILLGGDSLPRKKPEPDQLLHACAQLTVPPVRTVYVGDDERDVQAANAAGMRSVGALWGYRPLDDDPARWRADALIEAPLELIERGLLQGL